jgi:hypothetical protein
MISPCKPPLVFRPKSKRLNSKYMTITVAFLCKDGVVLGADSQESFEGSALKRSVPKLAIFPPLEDPVLLMLENRVEQKTDRRAIFTGAGDSALVDKLIDEMWVEIASADASVEAIASAVEHRIKEIYAEYKELYHAGYLPSAQLTFGIWCGGESSLFYTEGPIVNRVSRDKFGKGLGYKAAGLGREITDYIRERLNETSVSVIGAAVLATYMLEQAIEYGQGCGGDIRMAYLKNDGTAAYVPTSEHTTKILEWLDAQMSRTILLTANPEIDDKSLDLIWEITKKGIFELRKGQLDAIEQGKKNQEEYESAIAGMMKKLNKR